MRWARLAVVALTLACMTAPARASVSCSPIRFSARSSIGVFVPGDVSQQHRARFVKWTRGGHSEAFHFGTVHDVEGITGQWDTVGSTNGLGVVRAQDFHLGYPRAPETERSFRYGLASDQPVVGDWDGDALDSIAVLRRTGGGYRWLERNVTRPGDADRDLAIAGPAGAVPIAGDWNRDGRDDPGLYLSSEARFFLFHHDGRLRTSFRFGRPGDDGFVGDWNGDGIDTPGIRRVSDGTSLFAVRNSNGGGPASATAKHTTAPWPGAVAIVFDNDAVYFSCND